MNTQNVISRDLPAFPSAKSSSSSFSSSNPPSESLAALAPSRPCVKLQRDLGFWQLTVNGQSAILKHEVGLDYVAYLMDHPGEHFHGLALALKIRAARNGESMESADMIQERALALDDAEAGRRLFLKQRELEEITEDPLETDIIKEEAARELAEIYAFQKKNVSRTNSLAQKASDSVGKAIKRLYAHLSKAADKSGQPHSVLRAFAQEIRDHILIPSGRAIGHGGMRIQAEAGFFVFVQPIQASAEKEN